jgi:RimJ/RimL family protein N-acetyltransferase
MSLPTIEIGLPGWTLRAWRAADAEALARYADNLRIWRHMSDAFPHPYPIELAQHWVTHGHVDFGGDNWAIALHDEAAGGGGLHPGAVARSATGSASRSGATASARRSCAYCPGWRSRDRR